MGNLGTAVAVGLGIVLVCLIGYRATNRKRRASDVLVLLDERDEPLLNALDELLIRRELAPVGSS